MVAVRSASLAKWLRVRVRDRVRDRVRVRAGVGECIIIVLPFFFFGLIKSDELR